MGHSPAVGTPEAWRGNKGPPMRLHGKDLDIAALLLLLPSPCLGKLPKNNNRDERKPDSAKAKKIRGEI